MGWLQEMEEKGITEFSLSLEELQKLLVDGEITPMQFQQILIENLGEKKYWKIFNESLKDVYGDK